MSMPAFPQPEHRLGLLPVYRALIRRDILGVFYHAAAGEPVPHVDPIYPHRPVDLFERDLRFLKTHFNTVPYDAVQSQRVEGKGALSGAVHLSFDDGFRECFTVVRPLLMRYGIPATFFVPTDFIDNRSMYYRNKAALCIERVRNLQEAQLQDLLAEVKRRFGQVAGDFSALTDWILSISDGGLVDEICEVCGVDWSAYLKDRQPYLTTDQIRQLSAEGFTIGAHSRSHTKLNRLEKAEIEAEINGSCAVIREITGCSPVPFSFPNSAAGLDRELLSRIRRENPQVGLYFDTKGLNRDRKFIVNRIWIEAPRYNPSGRDSLDEILKRAYSAYILEKLTRGRRLA